MGTSKDVFIFEQVGFKRQNLLHAQRPLLIPRAGEAQRFVPSGQLHASCSCRFRQRNGKHFEHNSLNVVFWLRFGKPKRVHLHAVPEAASALVGNAITLKTNAVPQFGECAHLAYFFNEANTSVDKE